MEVTSLDAKVELMNMDLQSMQKKITWLEQFLRHEEKKVLQVIGVMDALKEEINANRRYINAMLENSQLKEI